MTHEVELRDLRASIDNLDDALIAILAERFRLTEKVGILKSSTNLEPMDAEREEQQMQRYRERCVHHAVDPVTIVQIMSQVIDCVKARHRALRGL